MNQEQSSAMPDEFDRLLGNLDGLPDVTHTKASTLQYVPTLGVGGTRTFIVQTFRQADQGDTIFIQVIGAMGSLRLVLPATVTTAIARQHDSLTSMTRSKAGKRRAATDKANGIMPGFMRKGRKR